MTTQHTPDGVVTHRHGRLLNCACPTPPGGPQVYTLAEIRNGTGFPPEATFIAADPKTLAAADLLAALRAMTDAWTVMMAENDEAGLAAMERALPAAYAAISRAEGH